MLRIIKEKKTTTTPKQTNKNHGKMCFKIALMITQLVNVQAKQESEAQL